MSKPSKRPGRANRPGRGVLNSSAPGPLPSTVPNELADRLNEQIRYLGTSAHEFDEGHRAEGKRIATVTRTLVCDTKRMKSLLGQMRLLHSLTFEDSVGGLTPGNLLPESPLISLATGPGEDGKHTGIWLPRLDTPHPFGPIPAKPFAAWWSDPVIKDENGHLFTRANLVRFAGDKDGGHHVDPHLPAPYWDLSRRNSMGWMIHDEHGDRPMTSDPVLASLRQIGHELLATFKRHEPELAPLGVVVADPPGAGMPFRRRA